MAAALISSISFGVMDYCNRFKNAIITNMVSPVHRIGLCFDSVLNRSDSYRDIKYICQYVTNSSNFYAKIKDFVDNNDMVGLELFLEHNRVGNVKIVHEGDQVPLLVYLVSKNRPEMIQACMAAGMAIHNTDHVDDAILLAAMLGHAEMVEPLLLAGCDINKKRSLPFEGNNYQATALDVAAHSGHAQMVQTLIKKGALLPTNGELLGHLLQQISESPEPGNLKKAYDLLVQAINEDIDNEVDAWIGSQPVKLENQQLEELADLHRNILKNERLPSSL